MNRRTLLQSTLGAIVSAPLLAAVRKNEVAAAVEVLAKATDSGLVRGATLYVRQGTTETVHALGTAKSPDPMFLLGSISKPMSVAALMTLYDAGKFALDDAAQKFLPEF